jgi:hypothetical protein
MLALLVAVAASFVACDRKTIYVHYEHTPITGWDKSDYLNFDVPAIKEEGAYKEDIGLRVVNTYPFQGLSLVIKQTILLGLFQRRAGQTAAGEDTGLEVVVGLQSISTIIEVPVHSMDIDVILVPVVLDRKSACRERV